MSTQPVQESANRRPIFRFTALVGTMLLAFASQSVLADDVPDRDRRSANSAQISGIYKVASSNDPFFPIAANREWFMDFGGTETGARTSGNVSVSLRQNPSVKVRIMVWQYFPQTSQLYLGSQFSEGSRQAVALADWQIRNVREGVLLERNGRQIVLRRTAPGEY